MRPLIRLSALIAASLILTSCGGRSSLPVEPIRPPAPQAGDPRLCAEPEPEPVIQGSVVAPATSAEATALRLFLTSVAALADWGRAGWARAEVARAGCDPGR